MLLEKDGITIEFPKEQALFASSFLPVLAKISESFSKALNEKNHSFIAALRANTAGDLRFLSESFVAPEPSEELKEVHAEAIDEVSVSFGKLIRGVKLKRFFVWERSKLVDILAAGGEIENFSYDGASEKLNFQWDFAVSNSTFSTFEQLFSLSEDINGNAPPFPIVLKGDPDSDLENVIETQRSKIRSFQSTIERLVPRMQAHAYYSLLTYSALKTLESLDIGLDAPDLQWFAEGVAMTHAMFIVGERSGPEVLKSVVAQNLNPVINGLSEDQIPAFLAILKNYDFTKEINPTERFAFYLEGARQKISFSASISMMRDFDMELPFRLVLLDSKKNDNLERFDLEKLSRAYEKTFGRSPESFFAIAQDRLWRSIQSGKLEPL